MVYEDRFLPRPLGYLAKVNAPPQDFCMIRTLCFVILTTWGFTLSAQIDAAVYHDGRLTSEVQFQDSLAIHGFINQELIKLWTEGYLYSGLDSINDSGLYFHQAEKFAGTLGALLIHDADLDTFYQHQQSGQSRQKAINEQLDQYANSGYPFVTIRTDSIQLAGTTYQQFLQLRPGPRIVYDSLELLGEAEMSKTFISRVIKTELGEPYSEKSFRQIPQRLERLDFVQLQRAPDVAFENGKAIVYLDLTQRKSSSFEGVVGLLPRQSGDQGLAVTGYANLQLANLFQSGKHLGFTWNRFADQSQTVDLSYYHPFFLSSRLFLDVNFELLKQDTTFLNQSWDLRTGAYLGNRAEIFFGYEAINGSLISPSEIDLNSGFADFKTNRYRIGLRDALYDQDLRLYDGIRYHADLLAGDKQILKNPAIASEQYDSLMLQTLLVKFNAGIKYLLRLQKATAIYHQVEGQLYFNDELLDNELTRLGGLRTLRGFNEKFFFVRHYVLSRLELRQYFEERSYFMVFYDQLMMTSEKSDLSWPRGFGGGLTLNTSNGLFTFAMALGSSADLDINPAEIKIHIGYISVF